MQNLGNPPDSDLEDIDFARMRGEDGDSEASFDREDDGHGNEYRYIPSLSSFPFSLLLLHLLPFFLCRS